MKTESKSTQDSPLKTSEKVLLVDLKSIPKGVSIDQIMNMYLEHGVLFYDSHEGGNKPEVINLQEYDGVRVCDIQDDIDLKAFEQELLKEHHQPILQETIDKAREQAEGNVADLLSEMNQINPIMDDTTITNVEISSTEGGIIQMRYDATSNSVTMENTPTMNFGEEFDVGSQLTENQSEGDGFILTDDTQ